MDWATFAAIIVAVVAVYGAAVSTYNLVMYYRGTKASLKVKLSYGSAHYPDGVLLKPCYSDSTPHLVLTVVNSGTRPVTIRSPFVELPNKGSLLIQPYSHIKLPHELLEGKYCIMWIEASKIAHKLKEDGFSGIFKLVVSVSDALDRTHSSNPLEFDINKCSKS